MVIPNFFPIFAKNFKDMAKKHIVIIKKELTPDAKSYDDIKSDKYLKSIFWDSNGYPKREWTNSLKTAIHWHDKPYAKCIAQVLSKEVPYPVKASIVVEKEIDDLYTNLDTLGKILEHKGEPLLFGYWDINYPDYGWVCEVEKVKSPCSDNGDDDPDAYIDGLAITATSRDFVVLYNGEHPERNGQHYRRIYAYSKDQSPYFDGQLFCRTMTPSELKIYKKVKAMKNMDKPLETYLDINDKQINSIWNI